MFEIIPASLKKDSLKNLIYLFYGGSGAGMIPLMEWLLDAGAQVFAIDDGHPSFNDKRVQPLASLAEVPSNCCATVYTTRLEPEHPFFDWARASKNLILCCSRPRFLEIITRQSSLIAVTGTHGKTNTTTALSWMLEQQGLPVDYIIGGQRCDSGRYGYHNDSQSPWMVIEADESQTTLQYFHPEIAIVLNSSGDHLEFFDQNYEKYHDNIANFIAQSAIAILDVATAKQQNWHHENAYYFNSKGVITPQGEVLPLRMIKSLNFPIITQTPHAWQFQAAALALCHALGLPLPLAESWKNYQGVKYRLEELSACPLVFRDYGHHPTELLSIYKTLRRCYPEKELVLVFQPHKYTRTKREFWPFVDVLRQYDKVYLMPTEAASEEFDGAFESYCFLEHLCSEKATYWATWDALESFMPGQEQVLLFQGAGRIMRNAYLWAQACQECIG